MLDAFNSINKIFDLKDRETINVHLK